MEPANGASTWALGSQIWEINNGSFTKKAIIEAPHQMAVSNLGRCGEINHWFNIDRDRLVEKINSKEIIKGSEAVKVYIIK
jgi:hypothetical protein